MTDDDIWAPAAGAEVELTTIELSPQPTEVTAGPSADAKRARHPVVLAVGVIAALALAALGITTLTGPNPDSDSPDSAAEPSGLDATTAGPSELATEQSLALVEAHPAAENYLVFFRSGLSLALVDFRDGSSTLLDWSVPDQVETTGFLYMASERGSWVVDPQDLSLALRLAPNAQIGVLENPSRTAVLAEAAGATTVLGGFFDGRAIRILAAVPVGAEAEVVQNLGIIISPLSGGSYLVQDSSPVLVSDGRIVAANKNWFGEVLCDERLQCTGNIRSWADDVLIEVPLDVLTAPVVRISPDGRWVLTGGGDRWSVYDIADDSSTPTGAEVVPNESASWSPDSSFIIWIEARSLFVTSPERPLDRFDLALEVDSLPTLLATEIGFMPLTDTE